MKYKLINNIMQNIKKKILINTSVDILKNYIIYSFIFEYENIIYIKKHTRNNLRYTNRSNYSINGIIWYNIVPLYYELECMDISTLERIILENII